MKHRATVLALAAVACASVPTQPEATGQPHAELTEHPASAWPGSETEPITITLTNLCPRELEFGFTPGGQQLTEVRRLPPLSRQRITIPRGFGLRAREIGTDRSLGWCSTEVDEGNVWIASGCNGCGARDQGSPPDRAMAGSP